MFQAFNETSVINQDGADGPYS